MRTSTISCRFLRKPGTDIYQWGFTYRDSRGKTHRHYFPPGVKPISDRAVMLRYAQAVINTNEARIASGMLVVIRGLD